MLVSPAAPRPALEGRAPLFPTIYEAPAPELLGWLGRHREELRAAATSAGAILLRGFAGVDAGTFAQAAALFGGPLGEHYEGPSPRVPLAPGVYTASEVWSALVVAEHAEMSYLPQLPRYLYFWCRQPARHGGATTLVDGRRVLARLDARRIAPLLAGPLRIRRRHARPRGWHDPFELKRWPSAFGTDRREALALRAQALGCALSFERDGAITLEHRQPAVRRHPESVEEAWLNHLLVFHGSAPAATLASALCERELRALLPYPLALAYRALTRAGYRGATEVALANGEPVPDRIVAHVREVVDREAIHLDWRAGDLLIVDNHIALHGRRPYRGAREVIVAWSHARA